MSGPIDDWPGAAAFMGPAYLRYSFTKGTEQEVAFLCELLMLGEGGRVLDVGCGPGRHAWALAARGVEAVGVDISPAFVALAVAGPASAAGGADNRAGRASFCVGDARRLPFPGGAFPVVLSLCQGGFGLLGDDDLGALTEMARVAGPGGTVVFSAFSSYFAVRHLEDTDDFDAAAGVNTEHTTVRDGSGRGEATFVMSTSCFTPRELRLLVVAAGLELRHLWSVTPGDYAARSPDLDHPELLVVAAVPLPARW